MLSPSAGLVTDGRWLRMGRAERWGGGFGLSLPAFLGELITDPLRRCGALRGAGPHLTEVCRRCSLVTRSCLTLATPWPVAHQAPPSMGFSRHAYWSGLPFPPPGDLPDPGIEPASPALAGGFLTTEPPGKP